MPGTTPPTSQLDWLSSTTAMIVLFWSRATRDLLKSFGWGIGALHRLDAATKLPFPRRPPHSISRSPGHGELGCRVILLGCVGGVGALETAGTPAGGPTNRVPGLTRWVFRPERRRLCGEGWKSCYHILRGLYLGSRARKHHD